MLITACKKEAIDIAQLTLDKPLDIDLNGYLVDFNVSLANFDILINDVVAFSYESWGSIYSNYPINIRLKLSDRPPILKP